MDDALDPVLVALADPTRRELIERLALGEAASATALAAELPISRQAVAKHLAVLQRAGLVRHERVGREVRYRIDDAPLAAVVDWLELVGARWDARLARLERRFAPERIRPE